MEKNSSMSEEVVALFMERFPSLGLLLPRWTPREEVDEACPPIKLDKEEVVYLYGLGAGKGYFQCREWLKKRGNKLIFLEEDPGVIASFLRRPEAAEILSHPQVFIELFSHKPEEIEALAAKFPVKRMEFISRGDQADLRLEFLRKTALSHALHTDRLHGYQPFGNFLENVRQWSHSFYANGLKGAFQNIPAVICGAGPSLQSSLPILRQLEHKALLIAGGSTLAALSSQGIMPHFGMAVDPNLEEYRRLKNSFAFEVPLLYSTRVHPSIFQTANGPFGYMRAGIGGVPELWLEEELRLLDPLIGEFLSPESISVTSICLAWAQFLGCNPILLNGIDMAYTGNKRYAEGVAEEEVFAFQAIEAEKSAADRILLTQDRTGQPVYTAVRWVMESASISYFAKNHPEIHFVNTTEGGIGFEGIAYKSLAEAVAEFKSYPLRQEVYEKISRSPMPKETARIVSQKIDELKQSLDRVIEHLQVLAGEKKGSTALAEFDLREEIATLYLFYDIDEVLGKEEAFWKRWLQLANQYAAMMNS